MEPSQGSNAPQVTLFIQDPLSGRDWTVRLRRPVTLIGSREGCKVRLRCSTVAPVQAVVLFTGQAVVLKEVCGSQRTQVNDRPTATHMLADGDRIRIGRWEIVVRVELSSQPPPAIVHTAATLVLAGEDGSRVRVSARSVLLVGRHPRCDVGTQDGRVSRAHAVVFPLEGGWAVADLLSANGTWVDEEWVSDWRPIRTGAVVRTGRCRWTMLADEPDCLPGSLGGVREAACEEGPPLDFAGVRTPRKADNPITSDPENGARVLDDLEEDRKGRDVHSLAEDLDAGKTHMTQTAELEMLDQELTSCRRDLDARTQACCESEQALREKQAQVDDWLEDLRTQEASLQPRENALREREKAIEARAAELQIRRSVLQHADENMAKREEQVRIIEPQIEERLRRAEMRDRELGEREAAIQPTEARLAERGLALERDARTLTEREKEVARREEAVAAAQRGLDDRAVGLSAERVRCETLHQQVVRQGAELESRAATCEGRERRLEAAEEDVRQRLEEVQGLRQSIQAERRELDVRLAAAARQRESLDARKSELDRLAAQVAGELETVAAERYAIDERATQLAVREEELRDRQESITRLSDELAAREQESRSHETRVHEQAARQQAAQSLLDEREKRIAPAEQRIADDRRRLDEQTESCARLRRELDERAACLSAEHIRCEALHQQLVRQGTELETRAAACEGRERQLAAAEEGVRQRLQEVQALRESVQAGQREWNERLTAVARQRESLDACKNELDRLAVRIAADGETAAREGRAIDERYKELASREQELRSREARVQEEVENRQAVLSLLEEREKRIAPAEQRIADDRRRLDEQTESCARLRREMDERAATLAATEATFAREREQVAMSLGECEARLEVDRQFFREQVGRHEAGRRELPTAMAALQARESAAATRAAELERQEESVVRRQSELERMCRESAEKMDVLADERRRREEHEVRIEAREHALAEMERVLAAAGEEIARENAKLADCRKLEQDLGERGRVLDDRDAQLAADRRTVREHARQLREKIAQLKPVWDQVKQQQTQMQARRSELDRREEALQRREAEPERVLREFATPDRSGRQSVTEAGELAGLVERLRVREQELAAREVQHKEYASVVGGLADTFDRLQGQLSGFEQSLRKREARPATDTQENSTPAVGRAAAVTTAENAATAPPARSSPETDYNRPALRSAVEILRRLGAMGTDEELLAKLARNPGQTAVSGKR